MHKDLVPLLGALEAGPMGFDDICNRVQSTDQTDTVNRLFALVRMNWVSEDNGVYSLTNEGSKQLEAVEPPVEDVPKLRTMELGRRPDEPPRISSSAPVPMFHVRVDRFGNPRVIPFTPEERAREASRQQDPRAMEEGWKRRAKGVSVLPPEWFTDGKPAH